MRYDTFLSTENRSDKSHGVFGVTIRNVHLSILDFQHTFCQSRFPNVPLVLGSVVKFRAYCRGPCSSRMERKEVQSSVLLLGHRVKEINGFCFVVKEIVIVIVSHLMRLGVEALISGD